MRFDIDTILEDQKQRERSCPVCKKTFRPAPEHAWTIGRGNGEKYVCSYTCMRAWERSKLKGIL